MYIFLTNQIFGNALFKYPMSNLQIIPNNSICFCYKKPVNHFKIFRISLKMSSPLL